MFDKQSAVNCINKTTDILKKLRLDSKNGFENLYVKAVEKHGKIRNYYKKA